MPNRNGRTTTLYILLVIFVAIGSYGLGALTVYRLGPDAAVPASTGGSAGTQAGTPRDLQQDFKPFWEAYNAIQSEFYYRPIDRQKLVYDAAKGMFSSLGDDFSSFDSPPEATQRAADLRGNDFEGIGAYLEIRNGVPSIQAPIPGTPAEKAGLQARDLILAVDGRDVTKMTVDQVASLVRGPAGSKVRLTIKRGNAAPFDVEIVRQHIDVPVVNFKMLDNNVAYIQATIFGDRTTTELDAALKQAVDQKARGLILDLRGNRGGYVDKALQMLGRFLPPGTVGFYESHKADHSDDRPQKVISDGPKVLTLPMAVLIDGGSASASELVAGALQDYGRARLIGAQSYGKGSEQHIIPLSDGATARVTFAHWLTPRKRDINPKPTPRPNPSVTPTPLPTLTPTANATQPPPAATATAGAQPAAQAQDDRGLTPDIAVVRTQKDIADGKDAQLERAEQYLVTGK